MNVAFHLFRLQKIDTQLDSIEHKLAEIARILADDQTVRQAEEIAQSAERSLEKARRSLNLTEEAAKAQRIKIELNEASLYGGKVRNPKELQDLQNEAASLKRHLAVLEDQQLEAMLALEEAEQVYKKASEQVDQARAAFATRSASTLGEQSKLQKEKERLQAERLPMISQIPPANVEIYNRLRRQKNGIAVAGVEDETCTICGSTLTPADWQAARSPHQITTCSSCGRILYAG